MYYCFLCNRYHFINSTKEHFIPESIDCPKKQWLPVCSKTNTRSNEIIDKKIRDILYWERFNQTGAVKRNGTALLRDGSLVPYKFSYKENQLTTNSSFFDYFIDSNTNKKMPKNDVSAIGFPVGLSIQEQEVYCKAIIKMTIGTLVFCLLSKGIKQSTIKKICSNRNISNLRCFALNKRSKKSSYKQEISLGQTDVIEEFHTRCKNPLVRNHAISIIFTSTGLITKGMLYSKYGWKLNIECDFCPKLDDIFLENSLSQPISPIDLSDKTLSPDGIVVINPDFTGQRPEIPDIWKNKKTT